MVEAKLGVAAVCCCAGALGLLLMLMLRIVSTRSDPDTNGLLVGLGTRDIISIVKILHQKKSPKNQKRKRLIPRRTLLLLPYFLFFLFVPLFRSSTPSRGGVPTSRKEVRQGSLVCKSTHTHIRSLRTTHPHLR